MFNCFKKILTYKSYLPCEISTSSSRSPRNDGACSTTSAISSLLVMTVVEFAFAMVLFISGVNIAKAEVCFLPDGEGCSVVPTIGTEYAPIPGPHPNPDPDCEGSDCDNPNNPDNPDNPGSKCYADEFSARRARTLEKDSFYKAGKRYCLKKSCSGTYIDKPTSGNWDCYGECIDYNSLNAGKFQNCTQICDVGDSTEKPNAKCYITYDIEGGKTCYKTKKEPECKENAHVYADTNGVCSCVCNDGYHADGGNCVPDIDDSDTCSGRGFYDTYESCMADSCRPQACPRNNIEGNLWCYVPANCGGQVKYANVNVSYEYYADPDGPTWSFGGILHSTVTSSGFDDDISFKVIPGIRIKSNLQSAGYNDEGQPMCGGQGLIVSATDDSISGYCDNTSHNESLVAEGSQGYNTVKNKIANGNFNDYYEEYLDRHEGIFEMNTGGPTPAVLSGTASCSGYACQCFSDECVFSYQKTNPNIDWRITFTQGQEDDNYERRWITLDSDTDYYCYGPHVYVNGVEISTVSPYSWWYGSSVKIYEGDKVRFTVDRKIDNEPDSPCGQTFKQFTLEAVNTFPKDETSVEFILDDSIANSYWGEDMYLGITTYTEGELYGDDCHWVSNLRRLDEWHPAHEGDVLWSPNGFIDVHQIDGRCNVLGKAWKDADYGNIYCLKSNDCNESGYCNEPAGQMYISSGSTCYTDDGCNNSGTFNGTLRVKGCGILYY